MSRAQGSKSTSRARYLKQRSQSQALIAGPGLFFTCARGKERLAGSELVNLLQVIAEETDTHSSDQPGVVQETSDEELEDQDIENSVQKELAQLKSTTSSKSLAHRFNWKQMDCECLGFVQFPNNHDPVTFANHLVDQIQLGRNGYGLRHVQRITPVSATCSSTNLAAFKELATRVLKPHFKDHSLQYRIEPIIRCHDLPLNRAEVIRVVGKIVDELNETPKHKVNLENSQLVVLVCVYRYVVGVSVVSDYDGDRKRFNLQAIAEVREGSLTGGTAS